MLIILLVVILLFGASRLPELAKSVGVSMKEFKKAAREVQEPDETTPPAARSEHRSG